MSVTSPGKLGSTVQLNLETYPKFRHPHIKGCNYLFNWLYSGVDLDQTFMGQQKTFENEDVE